MSRFRTLMTAGVAAAVAAVVLTSMGGVQAQDTAAREARDRAEIEALAAHPRVVAIGETGMDLYWPGRLDGCAQPHEQRESFAWHIDLAKRTGKPLMIHNRDADAGVLDVLRDVGLDRRDDAVDEGSVDGVVFRKAVSVPARWVPGAPPS